MGIETLFAVILRVLLGIVTVGGIAFIIVGLIKSSGIRERILIIIGGLVIIIAGWITLLTIAIVLGFFLGLFIAMITF